MRTRAIPCLLLATLSFCPLQVAAQDKSTDNRRTITVSGQAEVSASPDVAKLSVAVESNAESATAAVSANAERSSKVAAALKALLGKEDRLTSTRYVLEPRYETPKRGETNELRIIGYVARNEVEVETRNIDSVGKLLDAAIAAGANRVSGLEFSLSDRNQQLREALAKAGAEARAQAESIATALGVKLKAVISASSNPTQVFQARRFDGFAAQAMEARAPTPIEPGTVSVSASLQVTYEIE